MDTATLHEAIGYLASALVVVSLLMGSVLRLRLIGLVGAVVFSVYGVLIGSLPVLLTNAVIIVVHTAHLVRLLRDKAADAYFEVMRWPTDGIYLPRFLAFHAADIARSQPSFDGLRPDHLAWVVLRDAEPVGVVLARRDGSDSAHIDLDYVTPAHRDFTAAHALFEDSDAFGAEGITQVTALGETELHRRYLERMGFQPRASEPERWARSLD